MANRLAKETSPYLLQHADNPVDWYPWGEEALEKARREDKPIFLSIGYSACHWCHVMEHESFEDEEIARILNEHFVPIKVDREERPDIDQIYMAAVQAMTGHGGWPLSVFLTPEGIPFYGGTYYPPTRRFGMPSFREVLLAVLDAWRHRREEITRAGRRLIEAIDQGVASRLAQEGDLDQEALHTAFRRMRESFDATYGGWDGAPKFPQPMTLEFLLRYAISAGEDQARAMALQTLEAMARGGIYDQIGGGFHRYSVDERWVVPHFEKMLYDNAQLARLYLHAWLISGDPLYRAVAEETLDYVLREMRDPSGGFYSSQDADSEGEEGKFYLWTFDEVRAVLGEEAAAFARVYGVTEHGNFEGKTILTFQGTWEERAALEEARRRLFQARARRVPPERDDKVLASWNGLMLAALAEAARALGRPDYREAAEANASFLLGAMRREDGRLWHTWRAGVAKVNGYLDDYTHCVEGLLELYQTTFDPRWYTAAVELMEVVLSRFRAPVGFYDTGDDHEALVVRPRDLQDNALPSGNAMAAFVLLRLAGLAMEQRYLDLAYESLVAVRPLLMQYPLGFGQWLIALDYALAPPREVAILGDLAAADAQALLQVCREGYRPHQLVAAGRPEVEAGQVPLLQQRGQVDGRATAYVCVNFACLPPVTDPSALRALLMGEPRGKASTRG